ncbi:hypothetical protein B0H14DRAFT_3527195 [Mycena olivaceomarginata]|nr:hypothetical protein B0H14DRAFT_3527195 [Mycena olivaceomarginata]
MSANTANERPVEQRRPPTPSGDGTRSQPPNAPPPRSPDTGHSASTCRDTKRAAAPSPDNQMRRSRGRKASRRAAAAGVDCLRGGGCIHASAPPSGGEARQGEEAAQKAGEGVVGLGDKIQILRQQEEWLLAHQKKTAGTFYTKMTKLFTVKYGWHLEDDEDFEVDVTDPPDWVANKVVNEQLTPEEEKYRQEFHTTFRTHLGQWYRTQYANLLEDDKATFTDIFGRLGEGTRKPPRRPQLLHLYSEKRYQSHIKPRVEERKRVLEKHAEYRGEDPPVAITIQNDVTKECWEEESEAFQEEMVREWEREHEIRLRAWRESNADGPNRTPEEFSASLKSAAHYLQPFVDVIADRYGMCVSILMVGPIGEHGGHIEMRSVHSGNTRGLVEKDWPLHDPEGFTRVQTSMVDFGHHVFSQAECDARITAVQEEYTLEGPVVSPTSGTTAFATVPSVTPGGSSAGPAVRVAPSNSVGSTSNNNGGGGPSNNNGGGGPSNENGGGQRIQRQRGAWGVEWASLIDRFYNFEAAWGYKDAGGAISTTGRPKAMEHWLGRARKWEKTVDIGVLGDTKSAGTFVALWWDWWVKVQGTDQSELGTLLKLHGKNGLLQVMALLLWWGERVADGNPADVREWSTAVEDVAETLQELLRPGVIAKFKKSSEKNGVEGSRGKKRKAADG